MCKMKLFEERQIFKAYAYAAEGGQSLHLFSGPGIYPGAPQCFKGTDQAAHLFDQDIQRLIITAEKLGVRAIKVSGKWTKKQHVDLCGQPLQKAIKQCEVKKR